MANPLFSQHTRLSEEVFRRFMELPETESFQAEYICESTERPLPRPVHGARKPEQLPLPRHVAPWPDAAEMRPARDTHTDSRPCVHHHTTGIGGTGQDLRCKTRTVTKPIKGPEDL